MDFGTLLQKVLDQKQESQRNFASSLVAFDPGHTTGWAAFRDGELITSGQIDTTSIGAALENAPPILHTYKPEVVVMEDYRVYKWRQKHHVGSELLTTQVIGALELLALQDFVPEVVKQPAHVAKQFCTDAKLKEWGYYNSGEKHARDAIRHGCYWYLFGKVQGGARNKGRVG